MSLNALCLANFKAFGSPQRVPLRPITLLFGVNSAGKSSVLHSLALARHAVETGKLDVHRTRLGGDSIDLGGFGQYVHRRQRDQEVSLTFQLDPSAVSQRLREILGVAQGAEVEVGIGMESSDSGRGRVGVQRFAIAADGQELLAMSKRRDKGLRLDRANHAHPIFQEILRGIFALSTTAQILGDDDLATLAGVVDELVPRIATWRSDGLFVRALEDQAQTQTQSHLQAISRGQRQEHLAQATGRLLPDVLRDLVGGLSGVVESEIEKLQYLGPLRSYPPRHLAFAQHHDPNWLAGGGYAWDEVRTNHVVRERVNGWLGALETPYELQVQELLPASELEVPLAERLGPKVYELALALLEEVERDSDELGSVLDLIRRNIGLESDLKDWTLDETLMAVGEVVDAIVDAEGVAEEWAHEILEIAKARADTPTELVLIDKRSSTPVSHRDVGIGVSQVLPVLVSAYASRDKLIAIEQPEIHLHPKLQAELGDVFLDSALGEAGNRFLIETHSEHLLLRIMRRMRETFNGNLEDGLAPVKPEDVAVLFVEPDGGQSLVREMPLNERGELVKAWPGGFFEESMREIF